MTVILPPCTKCGRPLMPDREFREGNPAPQFAAHGGHGMCRFCYGRAAALDRPHPRPLSTTETWRDEALCREFPTEMFFPEGTNFSRADWDSPRAVCGRCPVKLQCLDAALRDEDGLGRSSRFGVLGGLTPIERHALAATKKRDINHGTESGYKAHKRRGEDPCTHCVEAMRAISRARKAARA